MLEVPTHAPAPTEAPAQSGAPTPPAAAPSAADAPSSTPPPAPVPPAPAAPTPPATPDAASGKGADGIVSEKDAHNAELAAFLAGKPLPNEPAATVPPTPAAPTPDPAQAQEPPKVDPEDYDTPVVTDGSLPKSLRVKPATAWQLEELSLRKRGYSPLAAAEAASRLFPEAVEAKEFLALRTPAPQNGAPEPRHAEPEPTAKPPASVAEADAVIAAAEDRLDAAIMDFRAEDVKAIRAEIRQLNLERARIAQAEMAQQAEAQNAQNAAFNAYLEQAEAIYPAMKDPNSPLAQRAQAIQAQWAAEGNPLYFQPESALLIAAKAAKDLGVQAGASPAATPPHQAPVPQTIPPAPAHRKPPSAAMLGAGIDARTAAPGASPEPDWNSMSRKEYEALRDKQLAGAV